MTTNNSVLITRVKQKIKDLMVAQNMSIYDLAQKADLTEACIRNWYSARNYTPSLEAIEKLCGAFEISVAELLCDNEDFVAVTAETRKFLEKYQMLNKRQKEAVTIHVESYLNS